MFVEILSKEMISAGAKLTNRLDQARLNVSASLWFYESDLNTWRFIIASPDTKTFGPKRLYKKIQSVVSNMTDNKTIALKDIAVVDSKDPLISLLKLAVKTGPDISGVRFSRNTVNGVFIEDAYIYRLT